MTFAEVAEAAFSSGPHGCRCLSKVARYFVVINLFLTYFGAGTIYAVIMGDNALQMYEYYTGHVGNVRFCILAFLVPLILLTSIRSLKFLAPVSFIANISMATALCITIYYFVVEMDDLKERALTYSEINAIPTSVAITIYAIEAIGVVMPLENQMKTPPHFIGVFGVLSQGMTLITTVYVIIGFLGYWHFGDDTYRNITLNLPVDEMSVRIFSF